MLVGVHPRRWSRITGYLLMAFGGATAFAIPAVSIRESTGPMVYLWGAFLLVGGGLCAYGAATDRWIGELSGLPLVAAAFGVYGVILALTRTVSGAAASLAFTAVALILVSRWQDISLIRKEATRAADQRRGAGR